MVHGIHADRVIIGGDRHLLPDSVMREIRRICEQRELALDFVAQLVGLSDLHPSITVPHPVPQLVPTRRPAITLQPVFQFKRVIDFFAALAAIIVLSPLFAITALLVLIDVGAPVMFWQQRIGQAGCSFLLYKFRTLRSPFDARGNRVPEEKRLSMIGALLRRIRLDELPQLFNVLVGDMSLIGPRPLLPVDQPSDSSLRLAVRPGITGWAQINGGNLINADEKGALDEWYVRNASLSLDLRIIASTLRFMVTGEKRSEEAVVAAQEAKKAFVWENPLYNRRKFRDAMSGRAADAIVRVSASGEAVSERPNRVTPLQ